MTLPDLLRTKVHLTALSGIVREHECAYELRTPIVPSYFHGNCLVLREAPTELGSARDLFAACFGAESRHELFVWGPQPASAQLLAEARAAGFEADGSTALAIDAAPDPSSHPWTVRPLTASDLEASFALADACDGSAGPDGDPHYREFKVGMRALQRSWVLPGLVTWWGVFEGEALIGQCGMARCDSAIGGGLGRFQAVEVHPGHQRRGVATAMIRAVARDAMQRLGCPRVLLEADPSGPAIALYERVGFRRQADVHALLRTTNPLTTRPEVAADHAGVKSLVEAAFSRRDEAELVRHLRPLPGVLSLVADRNGLLLGHVMFSPVSLRGPAAGPCRAVALAPLAVRPDAQRRGVGTALVRAGLDACRRAGSAACFVLGSPEYYGRFGFQNAAPLGLRCRWPAPNGAFQVLELRDGALEALRGEVVYPAPFDPL